MLDARDIWQIRRNQIHNQIASKYASTLDLIKPKTTPYDAIEEQRKASLEEINGQERWRKEEGRVGDYY